MTLSRTEKHLSIVIAVVSGKNALRCCLDALYTQATRVGAEVIVPFDRWTRDVLDLATDFPDVRFVDADSSESSKAFHHSHYDRRRAVGISNALGRLIAMTEDHAVPSSDWCEQILRVHEELDQVGVIGGAIENEVDDVLHWAWYYCDFGRYGQPLSSVDVDYVSDVNVSYKRDALMSVKDTWKSAYRETSVHWALRGKGHQLRLEPRLVVNQQRPKLSLTAAMRERIEWGRAFAETRSMEIGRARRAMFTIGSALLPPVLFMRATKNMIRQGRSVAQIVGISPVLALLVIFWSIGEAIGYVTPRRESDPNLVLTAKSSVSSTL